LDQTKPGLSATIRVDAFPDHVYQGSVKSVAVLPDQGGWYGSDTKVYETIVTIDEAVERLKPGMTAVVEIHVDLLRDVLTVPVQAIVQIGKETFCFMDLDGVPQRRPVKLGRTNDKFVQILDGLTEGDRVVLNPMAIVDEEQKSKADEEKEAEEHEQAAETNPGQQGPSGPQTPSATEPGAAKSAPAESASPSDRERSGGENGPSRKRRSGSGA
jgi:hypothetical protein